MTTQHCFAKKLAILDKLQFLSGCIRLLAARRVGGWRLTKIVFLYFISCYLCKNEQIF